MKKKDVPQFDELMDPTIQALKRLGGSASIDELVPEMVRLLSLPQDVAEIPHGATGRTELEYRAAWARTYLRKAGFLENSERGIWALTPQGSQAASVDGRQIAREISKQFQSDREAEETTGEAGVQEAVAAVTWQDRLLAVLQAMDPIAFERLCQRILRESGFTEVDVTKRSGDGGIDGHGTIRLGGLISFNVLFQSKRYKGNIGPDTVRDFRGAMVGRADKGVIISTGGFTLEARREATRDGAPPVDLIDGRLLAEKLKELKLGVRTNLVEHVDVLEDWFKSI
ncbi:MAG: restriction endonuclease [Nitrospira sp.]|nr:restriction endonuclease [Nitrospira sp.]